MDEARTRAVPRGRTASATDRRRPARAGRRHPARRPLGRRRAAGPAGDAAVVRDRGRPAQRPDVRRGRVLGRAAVNGGTWALGEDHLLHATTDRGATASRRWTWRRGPPSSAGARPDRTGFNAARITPAGDTLLTFDDSRPVACRTAVRLTAPASAPPPGVEDCKAFESWPFADGAIWSVIPKEHDVEASHVYARTAADGGCDLGPATAGTLTWCGDAAYFARDPQRDGDDAALMRWRPTAASTSSTSPPAGRPSSRLRAAGRHRHGDRPGPVRRRAGQRTGRVSLVGPRAAGGTAVAGRRLAR